MTTQHHAACRRVFALTTVALAVAAAGAAAGCAGQGTAAGVENAPVVVDVSDRFVTIQNRTGQPLVNVNVRLESAKAAAFMTTVPRIENQQRHQVAVQELRNGQGQSFNPVFNQARVIRVVASDLSGRRYEAEVDAR